VNGWYWELDKSFEGVDYGRVYLILLRIDDEQKTLVSSLNGKSFYEGAEILLDYTSRTIKDYMELELKLQLILLIILKII